MYDNKNNDNSAEEKYLDDVSEVEVVKVRNKFDTRGMLLAMICFILLVSIAVLAIVTYCTFNNNTTSYVKRDEFVQALSNTTHSTNYTIIDRDASGNALWDSIYNKYITVCVPTTVNKDTCSNYTLFINNTHTYVDSDWYISNIDNIAHLCSAQYHTCTPANISYAYDAPDYIHTAIINTGDARYLKVDDVVGYADGEKVLSEKEVLKVVSSVSSDVDDKLSEKASSKDLSDMVDELISIIE